MNTISNIGHTHTDPTVQHPTYRASNNQSNSQPPHQPSNIYESRSQPSHLHHNSQTFQSIRPTHYRYDATSQYNDMTNHNQQHIVSNDTYSSNFHRQSNEPLLTNSQLQSNVYRPSTETAQDHSPCHSNHDIARLIEQIASLNNQVQEQSRALIALITVTSIANSRENETAQNSSNLVKVAMER